MLPAGPRSTYQLPPTPQATANGVARQMIATIRDQVARSNSVRTGMMTTGCDGAPVINPLDGTSCNGANGQKVLFNPQTRTVLATIGRQANGVVKTVTVAPAASCATVLASLRTKRRFTDNLGNVYGPDGAWLTSAGTPAVLETDYVHQIIFGREYNTTDSGNWWDYLTAVRKSTLAKITGIPASVLLGTIHDGTPPAPPTANDTGSAVAVTTFSGNSFPNIYTGLNDAVFMGYNFAYNPMIYWVQIDSVGGTDTFRWWNEVGGTYALTTGVAITGTPQALSNGVTVQFGATTGHTLDDTWFLSIEPNNQITRPGVAVRGTIDTASACVNGGFPNNNVLVTSNDDVLGTHSIIVRDPDSLASLNSLSGHAGIATATDERFSFSANNEGLFFAHFYTTDGKRKIAVISVNPLTFAPTITEVITLASNSYTTASTFAVASTTP